VVLVCIVVVPVCLAVVPVCSGVVPVYLADILVCLGVVPGFLAVVPVYPPVLPVSPGVVPLMLLGLVLTPSRVLAYNWFPTLGLGTVSLLLKLLELEVLDILDLSLGREDLADCSLTAPLASSGPPAAVGMSATAPRFEIEASELTLFAFWTIFLSVVISSVWPDLPVAATRLEAQLELGPK
jgi:hypothetical protein